MTNANGRRGRSRRGQLQATIDAGVAAELFDAVSERRFPPAVSEDLADRLVSYGLELTLCELTEDHGALVAVRALAAILPDPPGVYRAGRGVVALSRQPKKGWTPVDDS